MFKMVEFFNEQGKILTLAEYKALGVNVPVKDYLVRRHWGTWNRVMAGCSKLVDFTSTAKVAEILSEEAPEEVTEVPVVKKAPVTKPVAKKVTK